MSWLGSWLVFLSLALSFFLFFFRYYRDITSRYVCEAFVCGKVEAPLRGDVTMARLGLTSISSLCLTHFCMAETLDLSVRRIAPLSLRSLIAPVLSLNRVLSFPWFEGRGRGGRVRGATYYSLRLVARLYR